jgi:glycosyltransferase involved in cell wall biosynthesis
MRVILAHDRIREINQDTRALLSLAELFPGSKIVTLLYDNRYLSPELEKHLIETSFLHKFPGKIKFSYHLTPIYIQAIKKLCLSDFDLLISNSRGFAKGISVPESVLHVCYLHQPLPLAWQSLDWHFPRNEVGGLRFRFIQRLSGRLRQWDLESAKRVDVFIADCEATARAIKRLYNRPSKVIYPPVDTDYFTPGSDSKGDYFMIVGPINRNRRLDITIEAFREIKEKLVVAGEGVDFYRLINSSSSNVSFTGYVNDDKLRRLYRDCKALIVTSNNSFSMASMEAAACGKPSISLNNELIDSVDGERLNSKNVNFIINDMGIHSADCSVSALKEAVKIFNRLSFNPEELRRISREYSKQEFVRRMQDFGAEVYSLFKREGKRNVERLLFD